MMNGGGGGGEEIKKSKIELCQLFDIFSNSWKKKVKKSNDQDPFWIT